MQCLVFIKPTLCIEIAILSVNMVQIAVVLLFIAKMAQFPFSVARTIRYFGRFLKIVMQRK